MARHARRGFVNSQLVPDTQHAQSHGEAEHNRESGDANSGVPLLRITNNSIKSRYFSAYEAAEDTSFCWVKEHWLKFWDMHS